MRLILGTVSMIDNIWTSRITTQVFLLFKVFLLKVREIEKKQERSLRVSENLKY